MLVEWYESRGRPSLRAPELNASGEFSERDNAYIRVVLDDDLDRGVVKLLPGRVRFDDRRFAPASAITMTCGKIALLSAPFERDSIGQRPTFPRNLHALHPQTQDSVQ